MEYQSVKMNSINKKLLSNKRNRANRISVNSGYSSGGVPKSSLIPKFLLQLYLSAKVIQMRTGTWLLLTGGLHLKEILFCSSIEGLLNLHNDLSSEVVFKTSLTVYAS
jgi:hypothetical protein